MKRQLVRTGAEASALSAIVRGGLAFAAMAAMPYVRTLQRRGRGWLDTEQAVRHVTSVIEKARLDRVQEIAGMRAEDRSVVARILDCPRHGGDKRACTCRRNGDPQGFAERIDQARELVLWARRLDETATRLLASMKLGEEDRDAVVLILRCHIEHRPEQHRRRDGHGCICSRPDDESTPEPMVDRAGEIRGVLLVHLQWIRLDLQGRPER